LTNSAGITTDVPTDRYTVEAQYAHWQGFREVTVGEWVAAACPFAPRLGTVHLTCNQSGATFQVAKADGQLLEAGELPGWLIDVPEGNYKLIGWHHQHMHEQWVAVTAGTTNSAEVEFKYGAAQVETDPPGATVLSADGRSWGVTPLLFSELPTGRWKFQLQLLGYSPVAAALDVVAQETNLFKTNLLSINYGPAMDMARQRLAAGDYDRALAAAAEALQVKPGDSEALAIRSEAVGRQHVRRAEALGKNGDYIAADKELALALESLPDNEEAKQLLSDFKQREEQQIERMRVERSERPKKVFDEAIREIGGAALFDSHEFTTGKPVGEVQSAIVSELTSTQPPFQIIHSNKPVRETFRVEAAQVIPGGMHRVMIVGGQSKENETRIIFKVVEFKKGPFYEQTFGALLGSDPANYVLINPNQPQSNEKVKAQLADGVRIVTECVQRAIGQASEK
jgi:hypothetical protein